MIHLLKGTGAGQSTLITDFDATTNPDRVTVSPAITQPSTDTTFEIEPALPEAWAQIMFGGTTLGNLKYSFRAGGIAAGDALTLPTGSFRTMNIDNGAAQPGYIEFLSGAATDTVTLEWL